MESEMKDNILMVLVGALAVMSVIGTVSVFAMNQQVEILNSNFF